MALVLEHCSKKSSRDRSKQTLSETYVGTQTEVDTKISTLVFGTYTAGVGTLESWEKEQRGGILYAVTITYSISYDSDGNADTGDELSEVQRSTLDCSILSLPIEKAPGYKTNWSYYLIGLGDSAQTRPSFWASATDTYLNPAGTDIQNYRWVKNLSEAPIQPVQEGTTKKYWQVVKAEGQGSCKPQKLGVESWDYSTYTITEVKEFNNRDKAGQAASKNLNKIVSTPANGDFSVTPSGCNWKVDSAQVQYDGEKWIVTTTYTMSGPGGWDRDLYTYV